MKREILNWNLVAEPVAKYHLLTWVEIPLLSYTCLHCMHIKFELAPSQQTMQQVVDI